MSGKKQRAPRNATGQGIVHQVSLEFLPSASLPMVSFVNRRMGLVNDGHGCICVNTSSDKYVFKIPDVMEIVDTQDGYIIFHLKPDGVNGERDEMLGFYKKDVKAFYVEFSSEVRYKSENEKVVDRASETMIT